MYMDLINIVCLDYNDHGCVCSQGLPGSDEPIQRFCRDEKSSDIQYGHVTSLAVVRTHRKLGIATKLMEAARAALLLALLPLSLLCASPREHLCLSMCRCSDERGL